ncbi:hypothetical protein CC78DRAFT_531893 [Lojkania enalia]|uniref:DUF1330 domain-containing protein n=1 Tax=Lojkania enalia TaxID=147567 RepID=A0A9P4N8Q5_9PLEO|nr:hypothetical protein CC78DRAFT_531893 [Didymosphaeria enalia]
MPCLPISYENLTAVSKTYDPAKPIYMLNLWKYNEKASYAPEHSALAGDPCSGREAASRYETALGPLLPPNAERYFMSTVVTEVVAPKGEIWDDAMLIKYESLEGFRKMVESQEYLEKAQPHRLAALGDFRLIMLDKLEI